MSNPKPTKQLGPSPLQQVHLTPELAKTIPSRGQAPDAVFWRRFSTAVHLSESADLEKGRRSASGDDDVKDEWLAQQYRERRRCRITCAAITLAVIIVVLAVVLAIYYTLKNRK